ncbi:MAG: copper chaperone PCu(A)C [Balneola sp.]
MKKLIVFCMALSIMVNCGKNPEKEQKSSKISDDSEIQNWARPGTQGQMSGAYFIYKNSLDVSDTLISVESSQAMVTQIHESYTTDDGLAGMREMKEIIVQPDENLILRQGGLHLMLMNLKKDLTENDSVDVTLEFRKAGTVRFILPVRNRK